MNKTQCSAVAVKMAWSFRQEAKIGAETALDACDYFVDDVLDVWLAAGGGTVDNVEKINNIVE